MLIILNIPTLLTHRRQRQHKILRQTTKSKDGKLKASMGEKVFREMSRNFALSGYQRDWTRVHCLFTSLCSPFARLSREPNSMLGMVERVNWACTVLPETSQFFLSELTSQVFEVMRTRSVEHEFSRHNFFVMRMAL